MLIKRFRFLFRANGKIDVERGIRTLVAMAVSIVLGWIFQRQSEGLSIALFAQVIIIADVGNLYASRATTLIATTIGVALALLLGTFVSGSLFLTLILVFFGLFLAGYLTVYGENGAFAGIVIGFALLLAITLPHQLDQAFLRAFLGLCGGIWTIFLALFIWPFQPNQPLRKVVSHNFQGIAQHLQQVSILNINDQKDQSSLSQVRKLLLDSRKTLTYNRLGGWGHNELRELLIVLIEDSDRLLMSLMVMEELIRLNTLPQLTTVKLLIDDVFQQIALICNEISQLILDKPKKPNCDRLQLLINALQQQQQLQKQTLTLEVDDYTSWVTVEQLNDLLKKIQFQLQDTIQTAQQTQTRNIQTKTLNSRHQKVNPIVRRQPSIKIINLTIFQQWWEPLAENFSLKSPLFSHALRLSIGSVLGVLIYTFFNIYQGFWIGLTLLFVLKPNFSLTFQRLFLRIFGTVLGVGAVQLILMTVHSPQWLEAIGVVSMAISISLIRFHYSLSVFFITAFALILYQISDSSAPDNGIAYRVICTLIGGGLALGLSYGFLREKQELRFANLTTKALTSVNAYFQEVMTVFLGNQSYQEEELYLSRYKSRQESSSLQAALEVFIEDPTTPFQQMEPAITLTNYIPRLGRGVTVLLTQLEQHQGSDPHPQIALFTQQVVEALSSLTNALQENLPPPPLPPLNETIQNIFSHLQELQKARLAEISHRQESGQLRPYLEDYNIVITELIEIVRRVETIHAAIARFCEVSQP